MSYGSVWKAVGGVKIKNLALACLFNRVIAKNPNRFVLRCFGFQIIQQPLKGVIANQADIKTIVLNRRPGYKFGKVV